VSHFVPQDRGEHDAMDRRAAARPLQKRTLLHHVNDAVPLDGEGVERQQVIPHRGAVPGDVDHRDPEGNLRQQVHRGLQRIRVGIAFGVGLVKMWVKRPSAVAGVTATERTKADATACVEVPRLRTVTSGLRRSDSARW
jgi:hypothetical protein